MNKRDTWLAHYGIKGQKWGVKNGPPYPLDTQSKSASEKKSDSEKSIKSRKFIKVGAVAVSVALATAGGVYLYNNPKVFKDLVRAGRKAIGKDEMRMPMPMNLQFFAQKKGRPQKPYKFKSKKEHAIVMNAFSSHQLSREDMKADMLAKDINIDDQGAYTYLAKNVDGEGTFVVKARFRIKDSSTGILGRNKYEQE